MFKIFIYTKLYLYHVKEYNITKHLYKLFIYTYVSKILSLFSRYKSVDNESSKKIIHIIKKILTLNINISSIYFRI